MARTKSEDRTRRGFGRLRQLPSGRWQASYLHLGAVHKAPATFPTENTAVAWLQSEEDEIDLDRRRPGAWTAPAERAAKAAAVGLTFREYAERWLEHRELAPHTRRSYEQSMRLAILPTFGDKILTEITSEDVRAWFTKLGGGMETRRARAYGTLTAILNTAVDDEVIDRSPARVVGGTKVKRTKRQAVLLEPGELTKLAEAMPADLSIAVLLAGWCGLRRGEVFALTRADVAADGSVVSINKAASLYGSAAVVGPTKTVESVRTVTVPPHIRAALVDHLDRHVGKVKDALLFTDPRTGGHLSEGRFRPHFFAAREAIGRDGLHFHDLRHFGGTMAAQTGATLKEIQARLGHTTVDAAMRYQAVAQGRADALAEKLSALAAPTMPT